MQVGSATSLQALESTALSKYQDSQDSQDFSFLLQLAGGAAASPDAGASPGGGASVGSDDTSASPADGFQVSGSFKSGALIAVGDIGPDGKVIPYSPQRIQSEEDTVSAAGKAAYSNALANFMALSRAGGQMSAASLTDHEQVVGMDGDISGSFDSSFSIRST